MSLIVLLLLQTACKNDDDNTPSDPLDALPEATTVGANTFGCLLDGEVFLPGRGINPLDCGYQLVDGEYFFALQANRKDDNNNSILLALLITNLKIEKGENYILLEETEGNATGTYGFRGQFSYTSSMYTGELIITRLDEENQIVSGTFWFDVVDQEGVLHQIREGRFDMEYFR